MGKKQGTTQVGELLRLLEEHGDMDADQLFELTGIKKTIIISTLFQAKQRGQVDSTSKSELGIENEPDAETGKRKTKRGSVYHFISHSPVAQDLDKPAPMTPFDELYRMFTSPVSDSIKVFDSIGSRRTIILAGFHG